MNITLFKNLLCSAAVTMLVASCATSTDPAGITKAMGDAAVDSATKNSDPITAAAIRNTTGYGTDPVPEAAAGLLSSFGL